MGLCPGCGLGFFGFGCVLFTRVAGLYFGCCPCLSLVVLVVSG